MGSPQSMPVTSASAVKTAPIGAEALAATSASGWFQMKATALETAITA